MSQPKKPAINASNIQIPSNGISSIIPTKRAFIVSSSSGGSVRNTAVTHEKNINIRIIEYILQKCHTPRFFLTFEPFQSFSNGIPENRDPGPSGETLKWDLQVGPASGTLRWDPEVGPSGGTLR